MKIEVMIYVYIFICVGMICFNIVYGILSRRREEKILHVSNTFKEEIKNEMEYFKEHGKVREEHKKQLIKKLRVIGNMRAFDMVLEEYSKQDIETVRIYLVELDDVFIELTSSYHKKDEIESAFFPYIIGKYKILKGREPGVIMDMLYMLLQEHSIFCRENAMQAIYTSGNSHCVVNALKIIDNPNRFYHPKLLTDGMMNFEGDFNELNRELWNEFENYSIQIQVAILDYIRFSSGDFCREMLELMIDEKRDDEIRFACIRYLGKYRYDEAYPYLLEYADLTSTRRWEYAAISSSSLSTYPFPETEKTLRRNLYNRNWYVRFNASQSLEKMGFTYFDLIDIIEGNDRYASEILRYRFDQRELWEKERKEDKR